MSAERLGIVVVNYGSHGMVEENLAGFDHATGRVVVVDNPTTPSERAAVAAAAEARGWELVTPETNLGFGGGANAGADRALRAGCTHLLFLNPDVKVSSASLARLVDATPEGTITTPRLLTPDGRTWFAGGQLDRRWGLTRTRPEPTATGPDRWLTGACLLVGVEDWLRLGGFDDDYFLYWEDIDLTQRFVASGGRLVVVDEVAAVHAVGATQGTEGKSTLYCDQNCRNRLRFAARHLALMGRLRWILASPVYAARVLRRDGYRASLRRPATILAAARGTLVGIALALTARRGTANGRR